MTPQKAFRFVTGTGVSHFNISISGELLDEFLTVQTTKTVNGFGLTKNETIVLNSHADNSKIPIGVVLEADGKFYRKQNNGDFDNSPILLPEKGYYFILGLGVDHFNVTF